MINLEAKNGPERVKTWRQTWNQKIFCRGWLHPCGVGPGPHVSLVGRPPVLLLLLLLLLGAKTRALKRGEVGVRQSWAPRRDGHFRYFFIFSPIKNDFLHLLSS